MAVALVACADGGSGTADCVADADCASGSCLPSGACAPLDGSAAVANVQGGADAAGAHGADGATSPETGDDATPTGADGGAGGSKDGGAAGGDVDPLDPDTAGTGSGGDGESLQDSDAGPPDLMTCKPNYDGLIERHEMPFAAGYEAAFRVTTGIEGWSPEPSCDGAVCAWDLVDLPGESEDVLSATLDPAGWWFSDEPAFATATWVAEMGELDLSLGFLSLCQQTQVGIFEASDDAMLLLGLASEDESGDTLMVYDPPLELLRFPLEEGSSWTMDSTASGPLCGSLFPFHVDQTITAEAQGRGEVTTPYGTWAEGLRVRTLLERHAGIGVLPTSVRSDMILAECFTSIATMTADPGADTLDAESLSEVRRLVPLP